MSEQHTATATLDSAAPTRVDPGIHAPGPDDGPRTDMDGLLVMEPRDAAVYLVMNGGYRHLVPNMATFNNLFTPSAAIVSDSGVGTIPIREPISNEAVLAESTSGGGVYLITYRLRWAITSPAAMNRYQFNWVKIQKLSPAVMDSIPVGPSISWPQ